MKTELSSVDLRVLVREFQELLVGSRVDKVFQVGERELVFRLYGGGSRELVYNPDFICLTRYRRTPPKQPSSFAMQLRKHLRGKEITGVRQHGFDRVVELLFDEYVLVFELFSKGNAILCDNDMNILGLLDWQKWRARTLGVGKKYEYPPEVTDPYEVDRGGFDRIMEESGKGVAATLATKFSLGGEYAEQVCEKAGVKPDAEEGGEELWQAFKSFLERVGGEVDARVSEDDVTPFGGDGEKKETFNDAVDDYFSRKEIAEKKDVIESRVDDRRGKIEDILRKQEEALEDAEKRAEEEKGIGDAIYARMVEVEEAGAKARELRDRGLSDEEILQELRRYGFVKGVSGPELVLEF